VADEGRVAERKRVLVVCGTAIATSTHVAHRIREICRRHGIDAEIIQARIQEVPAYAHSVDLIVATTQVAFSVDVPVESGIPFLTGTGEERLVERILQVLGGED
jgi:PTS system galactitol-specific IIB component